MSWLRSSRLNDSLVNKRSAAPASPALKASCALVSIKRLTSFFESPSIVSVSASRLLVTKSPWSSAKRAVLARIFDAIGSDAALASLNPSATLLITISAGRWLDDDLPMTSEVGGVLAHPTTRLVTIRMLNNLVVVFIRLFFLVTVAVVKDELIGTRITKYMHVVPRQKGRR